jgi:hypothetical protein
MRARSMFSFIQFFYQSHPLKVTDNSSSHFSSPFCVSRCASIDALCGLRLVVDALRFYKRSESTVLTKILFFVQRSPSFFFACDHTIRYVTNNVLTNLLGEKRTGEQVKTRSRRTVISSIERRQNEKESEITFKSGMLRNSC